jgi:hypothetical protein
MKEEQIKEWVQKSSMKTNPEFTDNLMQRISNEKQAIPGTSWYPFISGIALLVLTGVVIAWIFPLLPKGIPATIFQIGLSLFLLFGLRSLLQLKRLDDRLKQA